MSILVDANTTEATAKLTKYQRQLTEVEAKSRRGIKAQLGGTFNDDAFKKYQVATARAAQRAADKRAFKAQLGANFSAAGFRAYEKELDTATRATAAKSAQMRDTMRRNFAHAGQLAAVGIGIAGVAVGKLAIDFDRAMRNVNSIAQLPEGSFKQLEKSVLSLAGKTAQAPKTLALGLYDLVSSGFDAKQSMLILASSARAATAGLTDTATSTHAVAAVLNAYHRPAKDAAAVSDTLFQTVNLGVISFEQLSHTIGDVLPFASQLHVSLNQVGAAVSTMTKAGIGPEETMTRLKNLMEAFIKPSQDMEKAIKATGAASGETLIRQKGLQGALEAIVGTTDGTKQALAALFPNIRGLGGALALTGTNAQGADKDLKAFKDTGGATSRALSQQSRSVAYQWQKLQATAEAMAISFANKAIPVVLTFVQQMKDGKGAGGEFASAIKNAFEIVKTAVHDTVDALGGLKSTIEVLVGGYAVSRILKFAGALGGIAKGAGGAAGVASGAGTALGGGGAVGLLAKGAGVLSKASAFSLLLPVGIAFGAVLDHWIQSNAEAEGKKFADKFLAPMPDAIKQRFQQPIADATNRIASVQIGQRVNRQVAGLGTRAAGVSSDAANQLAAAAAGPNAAIIAAQYFKLGQQAGQATVAGLRSVRDVSGPILLQDFLGRLRALPEQARPEAAKTMLNFAAALQANGQLPVRQMQMIMHALEAQIPGLSAYLQQQGLTSDQAFAKALHFNAATSTLRQTLAGYRQQFGDWQISTKITGSNIVQNMAIAMQHLHQTVKTSSGQTRKDAVAELRKLHDQASSLFSSMADKTAQAAEDMRGSITSKTSRAAKDAASNLSGLASAVYGGLRSGAINAKQGAEYIQRALNATLKAFGATPIPAMTLQEVALSTPFGPKVGGFMRGVGGGHPAGAARGGLMQIGRPGQAGRDSVPLNVGGLPIAVAPGEQVAVFTRHQLPIVNAALGSMGGLPGLFSKVRTPNYMAQGGIVPKFASGGTVSYGQLEGLWDKAGGPANMAALMAAIAEAESRGNPLAHNPSGASGLWQILGLPFAGNVWDPLTNARMAVAKWRSQGLGAWATYTSGAYKSFLQGNVAAAGGVGAISAPKVQGGGTLGRIVRAVLGKATDAANALLGRLTPAGGGVSGPGPAGGPAGVGSYMGVAMADWVIASLQHAAGKGIRPQPTSGYRPGFDPHTATGFSEHSGTQYPHGAVDFGGFHDPIALANKMAVVAATRDFKWPLLAPIGFVDDGHASGTGHARGGFVGRFPFAGSFANGGVVPGPPGKPMLGLVHGGEVVHAANGLLGSFPSVFSPSLLAGVPASLAGLNKAINKAINAFAAIPSQGIRGQIQLAGLTNTVQAAQNVGDVGGQKAALQRILKLEQRWLAADQKQLKQLNKALRKRGLSKKQRQTLLQDKLALLQEIGTIEADIGSTQTSIADLTAVDTTGAGGDTGGGGGDTGGGGVTPEQQAVIDAAQAQADADKALTDAITAQTQALTDATNAINLQTSYMKSVGAVETSQAIKALSDVISGQIGGQYYSRATGSAGDGSVARY